MKTPIVFAVACLAPTCALAQDSSSGAPPDAVKGITAKELGGHMRFLASDLMRGRDTASDEIRLAGEYLASRLYAAGAEPQGDNGPGGKTYFQSFPLEFVTPKTDAITFSVRIAEGGAIQTIPCKVGTDFFMSPRGVAPGEIDAQVAFGGRADGGEAEDNFENLYMRDRVVLFVGSGRGGKRVEAARKAGALAILMVPRAGGDGAPAGLGRMQAQMMSRPMMTLGAAEPAIPTLNLTDSIRDRLFRAVHAEGVPTKAEPWTFVRAKFTYDATKEVKRDRNVFGFFPGSDPEKKNEVIIFSAHYDHVGVDEKGEIYNGSDDNASGTSALLEIAEAIGEGPRPARSVAFLWVSGEEKGLLGSKWFSDHSPLGSQYKIVADINLDMVSRNDGKQVGITPSPKHGDYSTLIPAAQETLKAEGVEPLFNADEFYARTDSYNFARKGIPVIFFFSGVHADYHKPTDDVDKADFEKAARIARAAYRLGYQMAQAPEAPKKIKAAEAEKPKADANGK